MSDTPGRMLALLSLLQQRPVWTGPELATRLGVSDRTVRRDVDRLRTLGYPVEAAPGMAGGYQLGRGGQLPPLLLGDDEAVAVALGLRLAVDGSVTGMEEAAVAVMSRLDQVLPPRLAARVKAVHTATAHLQWRSDERVASADLVALAQACGRSVRVRFSYSDRKGDRSVRLLEPYRLVRVGPRWYLVGRDVDRADWRTFRVDRVGELQTVGTPFDLKDPPDPVALVRKGLRVRVWPFEARIKVPAPAAAVAAAMPGATGVIASGDGSTVVDVGSESEERMVRYLAGLPFPCEVLEPASLRRSLAAHARALAAANAPAHGLPGGRLP
ncbi:MAG TPA: YafY family protein [Acidimicrobiales bacterium]|nr:YafY family protein [Acidimicrobiales bacterium]